MTHCDMGRQFFFAQQTRLLHDLPQILDSHRCSLRTRHTPTPGPGTMKKQHMKQRPVAATTYCTLYTPPVRGRHSLRDTKLPDCSFQFVAADAVVPKVLTAIAVERKQLAKSYLAFNITSRKHSPGEANQQQKKHTPPPSKAHQSQQQIEASSCSGTGRTQTNCAIGTPTGYTDPIPETHCKTSCIVVSPLDPGKRQFSATSETKPKKNDKYTEGKASIRGKNI